MGTETATTTWNCPDCTLENFDLAPVCAACQRANPASVAESAGCDDENYHEQRPSLLLAAAYESNGNNNNRSSRSTATTTASSSSLNSNDNEEGSTKVAASQPKKSNIFGWPKRNKSAKKVAVEPPSSLTRDNNAAPMADATNHAATIY